MSTDPADPCIARLQAENAQLKAALASRTITGQATGILMERYQLDADRAFEALVRMSQQANQKLRLIAEEIVNGLADPNSEQPAR